MPFKKGYIPWNKGLTKDDPRVLKSISGIINFNKGKSFSKEHKLKISKANKHRTLSKDHKRKISEANKGKKRTEEQKAALKGKLSCWKGKRLPKEMRKKMSEAKKGKVGNRKGSTNSKEHRQKMSVALKGRKSWNKGKELSEEHQQNLSISHNTKEYKEKMSRVMSLRIQNGEGKTYGKNGHYFSKKNNKKLHYRSSYELVAYQILEQLSKVKSYEVEPFAIPYQYGGVVKNTIPDILITYADGSKELVEVKPTYKLKDNFEQIKLNIMKFYARRRGMNFSIWTENELGLN